MIIAPVHGGGEPDKAVLRQVGAVLGGVLGLIVIVVFMPNLEASRRFWSLSARVTSSPDGSPSAGRARRTRVQTSLAFGILLLSGFGPTTDPVVARDRVLGILLGAAVMGVIDQTLWPVQARLAMRPTLARALRLMATWRAGARRGDGGPAEHPRGLRTKVYRRCRRRSPIETSREWKATPIRPRPARRATWSWTSSPTRRRSCRASSPRPDSG